MHPQVSSAELTEIIARGCPVSELRGKKVLLIVPDSTRSCPLGTVFKEVYRQIGRETAALDVMIALGTHAPMSEEAMCERLEISQDERKSLYAGVALINHEWDNPEALRQVGTLTADEISGLSGGLFSMEVKVDINKRLFDYDELLIIGPVFPHEVVGFSGGNKYLFPGVAGPEILNFFHWLGAVVTNPMIIGHKWTPVRRVVDRAAALIPIKKRCLCMVVEKGGLAGLFAGTPEQAWDEASELSRKLHITYKKHPFHTVLSCAPQMYDELWVGGKCMYKLEPVVADSGELIIYAPHIHEISVVHGKLIEELGYHCRDYFLGQWERFKDYPWGVIAHSTHVRGIGKYENGEEKCRVKVTLATGIPREICDRINMGYRDPSTIKVEDYANREDEGILLVPKAGEMLFQLETPAAWAAGS
ncbi:MAG: lactate racemase domain-containing protein [Verrucomicrobiota bacterium]